jgi:hypothetical protein
MAFVGVEDLRSAEHSAGSFGGSRGGLLLTDAVPVTAMNDMTITTFDRPGTS